MGLDQRSLDKLKELGRRLPQALPPPQAQPKPNQSAPMQGRHPLETETDPKLLFQQLMQASPDGSVPPHLLARLKQLEAELPSKTQGQEHGQAAQPSQRQGQRRRHQQAQHAQSSEDDALYVAFEQLLLEDDEL
ncbi:MAG: hypothetical protein ACO23C_06410 [Prochlorococcaceae cyanobacterium]|jgi:hypothetical protein